jgi:hypothetical protein
VTTTATATAVSVSSDRYDDHMTRRASYTTAARLVFWECVLCESVCAWDVVVERGGSIVKKNRYSLPPAPFCIVHCPIVVPFPTSLFSQVTNHHLPPYHHPTVPRAPCAAAATAPPPLPPPLPPAPAAHALPDPLRKRPHGGAPAGAGHPRAHEQLHGTGRVARSDYWSHGAAALRVRRAVGACFVRKRDEMETGIRYMTLTALVPVPVPAQAGPGH